MRVSKKKVISFAAAVLALLIVTGSWAYFTSTASIDNVLQTKTYGSRTIEEFTPRQDLEPGAEITKAVGVQNTGDYDLVVRIKMDEKWERGGTVFKQIAFDGPIDTVAYSAGPPKKWTAKQVNDTDGVVPVASTEETVIYKTLNLGANWVKGSDGYFYYKAKLAAGLRTASNLLESIIPASNMDIGRFKTTQYYSIANKATIDQKVADGSITDADYAWSATKPADEKTITYMKSETELESGYEGYAKADYTLTITTEVLQATKEAVDATWTMTAADLAGIKTAWSLS